MMRVVVDTDVLASCAGASPPGTLAELYEYLRGPEDTNRVLSAQQYEYWDRNRLVLVLPDQMLTELRRILNRPLFNGIGRSEKDQLVDVVKRLRVPYEPAIPIPGVPPDWEDNVPLATALDAGASYLVTQDDALLALAQMGLPALANLTILSPQQFLPLLPPLP